MSKSLKFWVLNGKIPKPATLLEWTQWFKEARHRIGTIVARTNIGDDLVSTIFLGIDYFDRPIKPLLFETMIFVDGDSKWCERCATWDEAEDQHKEAVTELKLWHENAKTASAKDYR